jgi:uncharacterized membrane protein
MPALKAHDNLAAIRMIAVVNRHATSGFAGRSTLVARLPIQDADRQMAWGGSTILCTRNVILELGNHQHCTGNGFTATGFANADLARGTITAQFK